MPSSYSYDNVPTKAERNFILDKEQRKMWHNRIQNFQMRTDADWMELERVIDAGREIKQARVQRDINIHIRAYDHRGRARALQAAVEEGIGQPEAQENELLLAKQRGDELQRETEALKADFDQEYEENIRIGAKLYEVELHKAELEESLVATADHADHLEDQVSRLQTPLNGQGGGIDDEG